MRDERTPKPGRSDDTAPEKEPRTDEVEEASEESFPASDPPSWSPLRTGSPTKEHEESDERR